MTLLKLKKIPVSLFGTVILSLLLSFVLVTSMAPSLTAGDCAIGGCDCGSCENCDKFGGRIDIMGFPVVVYYCSCPGVICQGQAL